MCVSWVSCISCVFFRNFFILQNYGFDLVYHVLRLIHSWPLINTGPVWFTIEVVTILRSVVGRERIWCQNRDSVRPGCAVGKLANRPYPHKLKMLDRIAQIIIMYHINGINFAKNGVTIDICRG